MPFPAFLNSAITQRGFWSVVPYGGPDDSSDTYRDAAVVVNNTDEDATVYTLWAVPGWDSSPGNDEDNSSFLVGVVASINPVSGGVGSSDTPTLWAVPYVGVDPALTNTAVVYYVGDDGTPAVYTLSAKAGWPSPTS